MGFLSPRPFLHFTHRLAKTSLINMQTSACSPVALHSTLTMDERWQRVLNTVEVESILFVTQIWNLRQSSLSSNLTANFLPLGHLWLLLLPSAEWLQEFGISLCLLHSPTCLNSKHQPLSHSFSFTESSFTLALMSTKLILQPFRMWEQRAFF